MSTGLYTITSRAVGTILTAAIYNSDDLNHVTNQNPLMTGAYSDSVAQMQIATDPGGKVGAESLATSLAGELERLRFALAKSWGWSNWYAYKEAGLVLNALAFGAKGDGTTDDRAALQAALDAAVTTLGGGDIQSGTKVYIPRGTYNVPGSLTITNKPVRLIGAGVGMTVLRFSGVGGGISFTSNNPRDKFSIEGMSLSTSTAGGGTAISVTYTDAPAGGAGILHANAIRAVEIISESGVEWWTKGIVATNVSNLVISQVLIRGKNGTQDMSYGIQVIDTTPMVIRDAIIYYAVTGIRVEGNSQGLVIDGVTSVTTCTTGLDLSTSGGAPGSGVFGAHFNTLTTGILINGQTDFAITGCVIYKMGTGGYIGINATSASRFRIIGNVLISYGTAGTAEAILMTPNAADNIIQGNVIVGGFTAAQGGSFQDWTRGITLNAGSIRNVVTDNLFNGVTTEITDAGTNVVFGNSRKSLPLAIASVPFSVANNGVISLGATTEGLLEVNSDEDDSLALYQLRGPTNAVVEVSDPQAIFSPTAGTANNINIYWSAGNSRYELENKRGTTRTLSLTLTGKVGTS